MMVYSVLSVVSSEVCCVIWFLVFSFSDMWFDIVVGVGMVRMV